MIHAAHEKKSVAFASVLSAAGLTAIKLVVGLLTGSLGLLAEAAHSGLDLVAALVTFLAVRVSDKPPDESHHYGHGKVENLSALVETLLLLITCVWIIWEALERLFFKHVAVDVTVAAFAVVVISIVVDVFLSAALERAARRHGSQALEADALHFRTDVWSSVVVLLGLGLVKLGDVVAEAEASALREWLARADGAAALGVALIVISVSVRLGKRTLDALVDKAPAGLVEQVQAAIVGIPGVLAIRRARVRVAGPKTFVDVVVDVDRNLNLERSHAITEQVEAAIHQLSPRADVVVHTEPTAHQDEVVAARIRTIAEQSTLPVHHISVHDLHGALYVDLDLEVDEGLNLSQAHDLADRLEQAVQADLPEVARLNVRLEARRSDVQPGAEVATDSDTLLRLAQQIAESVPEVEGTHHFLIRHVAGGYFLSLHCRLRADLAMQKVDEVSARIETRLLEAMPQLNRVVVHAEPYLTPLPAP
jgi:cation diffusion facilitator family transporter